MTHSTTNQQPASLDLDKLEALARAATPQDLDSAEDSSRPTGYIECPECGGEGAVELTADYCNYDGKAMGVQFYGIGPEHLAAEAFFRAANPATVLQLIALARRSPSNTEGLDERALTDDIDMVKGALDLCEPDEQQAFQRIVSALKGASRG